MVRVSIRHGIFALASRQRSECLVAQKCRYNADRSIDAVVRVSLRDALPYADTKIRRDRTHRSFGLFRMRSIPSCLAALFCILFSFHRIQMP